MSKIELLDFNKIAKEVKISDFCLANGYSIDRSRTTKRHLALVDNRDGEKIIIIEADRGQKFFVPGIQESNNIIIFIKQRLGKLNGVGKTDWEQVADILRRYLSNAPTLQGESEAVKKKEGKLIVDSYKLQPLHKFDYLNSRGLETAFLSHFTTRIFNNTYKSEDYTIFPYYNQENEIKGLGLRTSNPQYDKRISPHADLSSSLWLTQASVAEKQSLIVLAEAPIDALSYGQLHFKDEISNGNITLASFDGSVRLGVMDRIRRLMADNPDLKVILAVDRDIAGIQHAVNIYGKLYDDFPLSFTGIGAKMAEHEYSINGKTFKLKNDLADYLSFASTTLDKITSSYKKIKIHLPEVEKDWNKQLCSKKKELERTNQKAFDTHNESQHNDVKV